MCAHDNFIENQDGDKECLDCGEVYLAEDTPEDDTFNPESPNADDIPY